MTMNTDLNDEETEVYQQFRKMNQLEFAELAAKMIAQNPEFTKEFRSNLRRKTMIAISERLSHASNLLNLSIETLQILFKTMEGEFSQLRSAIALAETSSLELDKENLQEIIDLAITRQITEETQNSGFAPTGPTGPVGSQGPQGIAGTLVGSVTLTGPTNPFPITN